MEFPYRLINVFGASANPFSGNSVCVFEPSEDLSDELMQKLAQQVNMESIFMRSHTGEGADVAVYSPERPARLVGSLALGAAHVLSTLNGGDRREYNLTAEGETILVRPEGKDNWLIQARGGEVRKLKSTPQILASLVGLPTEAIAGDVAVVKSIRAGVVIPVRSVEDVRKTRLDARLLHSYAMLVNTEPALYVWAEDGEDTIESRMFFGPGGGVVEVAATGSGAANVGFWLANQGHTGIRRRIVQGAAVGRPSQVDMSVTEDGAVNLAGHVNEVAHGTFTL